MGGRQALGTERGRAEDFEEARESENKELLSSNNLLDHDMDVHELEQQRSSITGTFYHQADATSLSFAKACDQINLQIVFHPLSILMSPRSPSRPMLPCA